MSEFQGSYPFSGKLIDGIASYNWLVDSIPKLNGEALLCSAFLKSNVLDEFFNLAPSRSKVKILARWQLGDLIVGASDIEAYELCKKFGWDFYISLNFHGKVFFVPDRGILVGSANATSSGFGLRAKSNSEVGTVVEQSQDNISLIKGLFSSAVKLDDSTYEDLKAIVDSHDGQREKIVWPRSMLNVIERSDYSLEKFFLSECFQSNGEDIFSFSNLKSDNVISDLSLLGILNGRFSNALVSELFISTKIFKWMYSIIQKNGGTLSFGGLTAALHSALLENPAPYRKEVKVLVQNLYSWLKLVGTKSSGIEVFKPNYSEILRII